MNKEEKARIGLMLYMDNPLHRSAWELLQKIPKGSRTEYICKCITEKHRAEELSAVVYSSIKRALDEYEGIAPKPENTPKTKEAGEIRKNLFGFMASLQNTNHLEGG